MKKALLILIILTAIVRINAQEAVKDTSWKKGGFISVSFNQASLTNWSAGGENALSGNFVGSFFACYNKGKIAWDNTLDMGYGFIKSGDASLHKNEDKIELNSKYGHEVIRHLYYSAMINFKTQFAPGYNYPNDSTVISHLFAPAYLTLAFGMDYKPIDQLSFFLSPATGRFVFVLDQKLADAGQFGVDPATYSSTGVKLTDGKTIRFEFGASVRARFQKDLVKNLNLMSTLSLFNNYTDKNVTNRANINVDWQTMLAIKAGKLLTFSLFTHLLYDHNINIPTYGDVTVVNTVYKNVVVGTGPKTQFQEILGIGLSYKL